MWFSLLPSAVWPLPVYLDSWTSHPRFLCSAVLYSIGLYFTTRHIQNWVSFPCWLSLFILPGAISPLFCSSISGTSWPGKFIFQSHIFLPFHTVHGVLKARILKWLAISFSSGPHFVRTLHHDLSIVVGPAWHIVSLSYTRLWSIWSFWLVFWDCGFHSGGQEIVVLASICPLMDEAKIP